MKIGIANINRLLDDSKRGRALSLRLKAVADRWQGQLVELEGKVEKARQALSKAPPTLPPDAHFKLQRDLRMAELELRHADEGRRYDIEAHREHLRTQVLKELEPVFADVAKERGLAVVLASTGREVVWVADEADVTEAVMQAYDRTAK